MKIFIGYTKNFNFIEIVIKSGLFQCLTLKMFKMTSMALDDVLIIQLIYSIGPFIYQEKILKFG